MTHHHYCHLPHLLVLLHHLLAPRSCIVPTYLPACLSIRVNAGPVLACGNSTASSIACTTSLDICSSGGTKQQNTTQQNTTQHDTAQHRLTHAARRCTALHNTPSTAWRCTARRGAAQTGKRRVRVLVQELLCSGARFQDRGLVVVWPARGGGVQGGESVSGEGGLCTVRGFAGRWMRVVRKWVVLLLLLIAGT